MKPTNPYWTAIQRMLKQAQNLRLAGLLAIAVFFPAIESFLTNKWTGATGELADAYRILFFATVGIHAAAPTQAPLERVQGSAFSAATSDVSLKSGRKAAIANPAAVEPGGDGLTVAPLPLIPIIRIAAVLPRPAIRAPPSIDQPLRPASRAPPTA